jgi:GNAT superfamily N-acetyltransferase
VIRFVENDPALTGEALTALYTAVGWNAEGRRTAEKSALVLERSPCFVAAWQREQLVGFGRILSDIYAAQILDVMTHPDYRRQGVAREVVSRLVQFADKAALSLMLISAGEATDLYRQLGFDVADARTDVLMYRDLQPVSE